MRVNRHRTPIPGTPANLAEVTHDSTSIQIRWSRDPIAERYEIGYGADPAAASNTLTVTNTAASGLQAQTFAGLTPATTYYFRIRSIAGLNESDWSAIINIATDP